MKVITIYPHFEERGGASDLALSLAQLLNVKEKPIVLTNSAINKDYIQLNISFERFNFSNIRKYHSKDTIFISHHRKYTTILVLVNYFLFINKLKIIHVSHSLFYNLKWISFFPKHIVAVSNAVKENLISFFKLKEENIQVIFNGIYDYYVSNEHLDNAKFSNKEIKIILPAALLPVKQQVELVKRTKGKISSHVKIFFAGKGPDEEKLRLEIGDSDQYVMLGFVDIYKVLYDYDYVCLFSQKEGLPLSLIDGCMFKKPLITNNINSVLDINVNAYNGFVLSGWSELIKCLNNLPLVGSVEYDRLSFNSRIVYENKFSLDMMLDNYKILLSKVIKS